MIKDELYIMFLGLEICLITAFCYIFIRNEFIMNKFVITINKSFHFNCTPAFGIFILVMGEFFIWESKNNTKFIQVQNLYLDKLKTSNTDLQYKIKNLAHLPLMTHTQVLRILSEW